MFLTLMLALCISIAPMPKKCTVIDVSNNIVTVNINSDAYAFKGTGYNTGENIIVIMDNNEIREVL